MEQVVVGNLNQEIIPKEEVKQEEVHFTLKFVEPENQFLNCKTRNKKL